MPSTMTWTGVSQRNTEVQIFQLDSWSLFCPRWSHSKPYRLSQCLNAFLSKIINRHRMYLHGTCSGFEPESSIYCRTWTWNAGNKTFSYLRTYSLTPYCTVILEKLTDLQPVKKFPAFYGTRTFITALTSARHLSLSWSNLIQSITPYPFS
jgi:hypothetical protein